MLSNSAKKSGLPQPLSSFKLAPLRGDEEDFEARYARKFAAHLQSWWKTNGAKTQLYDPWLPELEKQKVD